MPTASSSNIPAPSPGTWCACGKITSSRPLGTVLSEEGQNQYGDTFRYLLGEPVDWKTILQAQE